jgi:hypothetical protein
MSLPELALHLSLTAGRAGERLRLPGVPSVLPDLPDPQNDPEDVRQAADDILSRPEYREPPESLVERIQREISEFLGELLANVGVGSAGAASWLAWLVLGVLVAGIVALAVWLVLQVSGQGWGSGRPKSAEGDPIILDVDEHRSAGEWLSEAERHESEGRWREGLLCRYRSLVSELIERKVIPDAVGRTAGEYLGDVRQRHPADAGTFAAATEQFEDSWYGGAETGPTERDRFVGLAGQVLATLTGPPVPVGAEAQGSPA